MSSKENAPISGYQQSNYGTLPRTREDNESSEIMETSLMFHEVGYEVPVHCRRKTKVILTSCSGIMRPGLNALMGPTGSGKTTLLDVLADRKGKKGPSGIIVVNGQKRPKNFNCVSGYVVQDDLMMGLLSVKENLEFSAALRLPSSTTRQQRKERVIKVIEELGLTSCANTKVGSELFRGISGGERKRTGIGMELIIEPQVLFLDEPTTGLDAHTAVSVIKLLKKLSETQEKRVIILSIHQPRYSIFSLFNSLTLLSRGQMIYHGPTQHILPYFETLGFTCGEHENPADFILDVLTTCEKSASKAVAVAMDTGPSTQLITADNDDDDVMIYGKTVNMADSYLQTDMYHLTQQQLQEIQQRLNDNMNNGKGRAAYARNIFWQSLVVTHRSLVSLFRHPMSLSFQVIIMIVFALIAGTVYFDLRGKEVSQKSLENVIRDRVGAFFFMIMSQVFSNMSAVDLFIQRKALFIHENASGYYRVSVFFFSQVITDLIAKRIIPVLLFSIITYFMIGFQLEVDKFFIYLLTLFMVSTTAASVTYAFSSVARVTAVATLLSALTFVLSMLFGGFFISLSSLPVWLSWLKYLSLFRYGTEALAINELRGQQYFARNSSSPCIRGMCINGTNALEGLGYETEAIWIWYDQIALAGLTLFFLTICIVNLQLIKKHK